MTKTKTKKSKRSKRSKPKKKSYDFSCAISVEAKNYNQALDLLNKIELIRNVYLNDYSSPEDYEDQEYEEEEKQKKVFKVHLNYDELIRNFATIRVKAKNEKEAKKLVKENLYDGKDYSASADWDQNSISCKDTEIDVELDKNQEFEYEEENEWSEQDQREKERKLKWNTKLN